MMINKKYILIKLYFDKLCFVFNDCIFCNFFLYLSYINLKIKIYVYVDFCLYRLYCYYKIGDIFIY